MKIKRFEAPNMSEALRMIKKEFGEDAVILSAKSVKRSRNVFGAKKAGKVVVTAAIDRTPAQATAADASGNQAGVSAAGASPERQARHHSIRDHYTPITRTGQQKLRSKFVRLTADTDNSDADDQSSEKVVRDFSARLAEQGVDDGVARDLVAQVCAVMPSDRDEPAALRSALSQVLAAKGIVAAGGNPSAKGRTLVLVGAAGAGKTTMAARFAVDAVIKEKQAVIISLDDQRIAGAAELERYGQLMNVPMYTAFDEKEVRACLEKCRHADVIVVDTPGISNRNGNSLKRLKTMLDLFKAPTIHLCVNATASRAALDNQVSFFRPLGPEALVFTQLDWTRQYGELLNLVMRSGLPTGYITDNVLVTEGIHPLTAEGFAALLLGGEAGRDEQADVTVVGTRTNRALVEDCFVANRNSDIFHRTDCRAVQRINDDNIVMFENEQDAMDQQFKPCRMCCSDLYTPKTIERPVYGSTAGNRYYA